MRPLSMSTAVPKLVAAVSSGSFGPVKVRTGWGEAGLLTLKRYAALEEPTPGCSVGCGEPTSTRLPSLATDAPNEARSSRAGGSTVLARSYDSMRRCSSDSSVVVAAAAAAAHNVGAVPRRRRAEKRVFTDGS